MTFSSTSTTSRSKTIGQLSETPRLMHMIRKGQMARQLATRWPWRISFTRWQDRSILRESGRRFDGEECSARD
jgi:hypothetical protein